MKKSKKIAVLCCIYTIVIIKCCHVTAQHREPISVIFETDMGNDVDDGLALAMLFRYADQGKVNLLGISNNKQSLSSLQFIDLMLKEYGYEQLPVATVQDGVEGEAEINSFARKVMDYQEGGRQIYTSSVKQYSDAEASVNFYRRLLSKAEDTSVVIISVGFSSNLADLLDSKPDRYSCLDGKDLIAQKVKFLSVMAGNLQFDPKQKEFNIISDLRSAKKVFTNWPTDIYVSPFGVGAEIRFPASAIEANLGYRGHHPLVTAYELYIPMPYSRETWDLTSVLFAIEKEKNYFKHSNAGYLKVDGQGYTTFIECTEGKHYYLLTPTDMEATNIKNRFVSLVMAEK